MNFKKMMVAALLLTLGSGMGFADSLTKAVQRGVASSQINNVPFTQATDCDSLKNEYQRPQCKQYLRKIQNNEILLDGFYFWNETPAMVEYKNILIQAAEQSVNKYNNHSAYHNAAVVYLIYDYKEDPGNAAKITEESRNKVRNFAEQAIKRAPSKQAKAEMYFVKASADVIRYALIDYGVIKHSKQNAKSHKNILTQYTLPDFEEVGKIDPYHTPWNWMKFMYNALGKTTDATRCAKNQKVYKSFSPSY